MMIIWTRGAKSGSTQEPNAPPGGKDVPLGDVGHRNKISGLCYVGAGGILIWMINCECM